MTKPTSPPPPPPPPLAPPATGPGNGDLLERAAAQLDFCAAVFETLAENRKVSDADVAQKRSSAIGQPVPAGDGHQPISDQAFACRSLAIALRRKV